MIRLVTQFDAPQTRAASATPTCSCSSCCSSSCCVATAAASMAFTAMSVHYQGKREEVRAGRRRSAAALGLLALPAALVLAYVVAERSDVAATVVALYAAWLGLVAAAYRLARAHAWLVQTLVVLAVATFFGAMEFFIGLATEAAAGYLVVELALGAVAIGIGWKAAKEF